MLRKPDAAMPLYYPNKLTDPEVDDLIAYIQTFPPTNQRQRQVRPGVARSGRGSWTQQQTPTSSSVSCQGS